jgi:hypothetical protein
MTIGRLTQALVVAVAVVPRSAARFPGTIVRPIDRVTSFFAMTAAKKQAITKPYMASDFGKCRCCVKATMFLKARFSNIVSGNSACALQALGVF